jgi:ankyrin repeat protein
VNGDTALHFAVKNRRLLELKEMLSKGGNPFIKNKQGETAEDLLESAKKNLLRMRSDAKQQDADRVNEILSQMGEMKKDHQETNESRVHIAARANNLRKIQFYHKIGAPLESYNLNGETPLELAKGDAIRNFIEKQTKQQKGVAFSTTPLS